MSKEGILEYRNDDGSTRRELVPAETLSTPEYLADYALKPVTAPHPLRPVTPETHKEDAVGTALQRARYLGGYVEVELLVDDERGIKRIKDDGWREISVGYEVELDETPGDHPEYGRYDAIQTRRIINHHAIVPRGRAGASVSMRFDSEDGEWGKDTYFYHDHSSSPPPPSDDEGEGFQEVSIMAQVNLDGVQLEVKDTGVATTINNYRKDMEGKVEAAEQLAQDMEAQRDEAVSQKTHLEGEHSTLKADMEKLKGEHEALKKDFEEMKEKYEDRKDALTAKEWEARAKERGKLEKAAEFYKIDKADELPVSELKRAIVKAEYGEQRQDATDDFIEGMLGGVLKKLEDRDGSYRFHHDPADPPAPRRRNDSDDQDGNSDAEQKLLNRWKRD